MLHREWYIKEIEQNSKFKIQFKNKRDWTKSYWIRRKFFLSSISIMIMMILNTKGIRDVDNLFNGVAFNWSTDEDYY